MRAQLPELLEKLAKMAEELPKLLEELLGACPRFRVTATATATATTTELDTRSDHADS
jgi:hypothetical protein